MYLHICKQPSMRPSWMLTINRETAPPKKNNNGLYRTPLRRLSIWRHGGSRECSNCFFASWSVGYCSSSLQRQTTHAYSADQLIVCDFWMSSMDLGGGMDLNRWRTPCVKGFGSAHKLQQRVKQLMFELCRHVKLMSLLGHKHPVASVGLLAPFFPV